MKRRKFVQTSLLSSAAALTGGSLSYGATSPIFRQENEGKYDFKLDYAPHFGMFENHAGKNPIDQIKFMADMGFTALEDNGMMHRTPEMQEKIGDQLEKLNMQMGVFVLDKGGNSQNSLTANKKEYIEIFVNACKKSIDVAKRCNAKYITVVPGNFERNLPIEIQTANVIEALRLGAEILEPHGLVMVLEPLSDTPDLFLRRSDQTYMICKAVNSPSCKILFDIYHMQKNEGNIIRHIDWTWNEIAYFQIGDNPGRNEPTTGEINYKNVFSHIYKKGYRGIYGMEHGNSIPGKEGEKALMQAYAKVDNFAV